MIELWVSSSKDGISVNAKYNAESTKECNEVSDKIQQCISWVNSVPTIHLEREDTNADLLADYERLRTALYGTKNESST